MTVGPTFVEPDPLMEDTAVMDVREAAALALAEVVEQARDYARASKAANTRRAYRADWTDFTAWCYRHHLTALPAAPETVALYLTARAESRKTSTLQRRLSAIAQAHKAAGQESPTGHQSVRAVAAGIRRTKGTVQKGKTPVVTEEVRRMVEALPPTLLGRRDAALLLLGFAGAFRRSELVALDVTDVVMTHEGLHVTIRHAKTDQEGVGRTIGIPYGSHPTSCPVRAVQAWLWASGLSAGALFRGVNRHGQLLGRLSDRGVARVVQRQARAVGLDPRLYAGHSLRAHSPRRPRPPG